MKEDNRFVSIVIRTLEGRMHFLDRALFSVFCNTYPCKEALIVYQGFNEDYLDKLKSYASIYPEMKIEVIQNKETGDRRARNLNLGIRNSTGRYLCFLDDDDFFYPNHLSLLTDLLEENDKAWAYSQVCVDLEDRGFVISKTCPFLHEEFSFTELLKENFIPLHTFLVDTYRIKDKTILFADESLTRLEDYYILLHLAFNYEPAFSPEITVSYSLRKDGSNSNLGLLERTGEEPDSVTDEEWEKAREKIAGIKEGFYNRFYWIKELKEKKKQNADFSDNNLNSSVTLKDKIFPPGSRRRNIFESFARKFLR